MRIYCSVSILIMQSCVWGFLDMLTCSITFCSVGWYCSTSSSFSPSAFNKSAYSLQWCIPNAHKDLLYTYNVKPQTKKVNKQSWQTALSFTGVPSSPLKNPKCFHTWLLPAGLRIILFSDTIFTTQQFKSAYVNIDLSIRSNSNQFHIVPTINRFVLTNRYIVSTLICSYL